MNELPPVNLFYPSLSALAGLFLAFWFLLVVYWLILWRKEEDRLSRETFIYLSFSFFSALFLTGLPCFLLSLPLALNSSICILLLFLSFSFHPWVLLRYWRFYGLNESIEKRLKLLSVFGLPLGCVFLFLPILFGAIALLVFSLVYWLQVFRLLKQLEPVRNSIPDAFSKLCSISLVSVLISALAFLLPFPLENLLLCIGQGVAIYAWILFTMFSRKRLDELVSLVEENKSLVREFDTIERENIKLTKQTAVQKDRYEGLVEESFKLKERTEKEEGSLRELIHFGAVIEHIRESIEYASRIQTGMLLSEKEICDHFPEAYIFQRPRNVVSGDFCWFSKVSDDCVVIAAADCTGHGVPGAFMTVMGNSLLHNIVNEKQVHRPDQILFLLNKAITETLGSDAAGQRVNDGMDVAICTVYFSKNKLFFSGAKNPLLRLRGEEMEVIKGSKFAIGGQTRRGKVKSFALETIDVKKDDIFFIYTDGFQDQFGEKEGRKYRSVPFRNLLKWTAGLPFYQQVKALQQSFDSWKGNLEQTDDVLVVGFKVK